MFEPICARARNGKGDIMTFENPCILDNYNCQHPEEEYYKINDDECKKS